MILASALLATGAFAQDAPSAPFMDPRVEELLTTMGHALTGAGAFAFTAEVTLDELHPSGMKIQHTGRHAMAIRRPDRIVSDVEGDLGNRSAWFDGKTIAVLDKAYNTYAVLDVPSSPSGPSGPSGIDAALDFVADEYDIVLPLADFIRTDVHESLSAERSSASTSASRTWAGSPLVSSSHTVSGSCFTRLPPRLRFAREGNGGVETHRARRVCGLG